MFVMLDLISTYRHAAQMRRGFLYLLRLHEVLLSPALKAGVSAPLFLAELRYCKTLLATKINHPASVGQAKVSKRQSAGFTLLELLVVITLLGVVMLTATTFIVNTGETERDESTSIKWHQLRTAIIGDSTRTLNGAPVLSGYVADMGRLPANIKELLVQGTQPAWGVTEISSVRPNVIGKVWGGWRGPYLYTAGSQFFRDGWGNKNTTEDGIVDEVEDALNFGWIVSYGNVGCTPVINCESMAVESLGDDAAKGGTDFNADFPDTGLSMVNANEWKISAEEIGFNVMFNKEPLATHEKLQLRVYFFENGAVEEELALPIFPHEVSSVGVSTQAVSVATPLPMGKYVAVVYCVEEDVVYDGDCIAPHNKPPYYFTLLPNTPLPISIPWSF